MYKKIKQIGLELFLTGLNNSHSGNISYRSKDNIYITRTGSMLARLQNKDIIRVMINPDPKIDAKASMELLVHRAIYRANASIGAIIHAHAPYSIVVAKEKKEVIPYDQEGQYYFREIPVLNVEHTIASEEVADNIVGYVQSYSCVIVSKHGVYAWGSNLENAYKYLTVTESSSRIIYLLENRIVP